MQMLLEYKYKSMLISGVLSITFKCMVQLSTVYIVFC